MTEAISRLRYICWQVTLGLFISVGLLAVIFSLTNSNAEEETCRHRNWMGFTVKDGNGAQRAGKKISKNPH